MSRRTFLATTALAFTQSGCLSAAYDWKKRLDGPSAVATQGDSLFVRDGRSILAMSRSGKEKWRSALETIPSAPTVHDGKVVFAGVGDPENTEDTTAIHAISADTGEELWISEQDVTERLSVGAPTVVGGTIVCASEASPVMGIDLESGQERWRVERETGGFCRAIQGPENLVYVGDSSFNLYGIDAETGDVAWQRERASNGRANVAVDEDLVASPIGGGLRGFDPISGKERWTCEPPSTSKVGSPAMDDETIYLSELDSIQAVRRADGHRKWKISDSGQPGGLPRTRPQIDHERNRLLVPNATNPGLDIIDLKKEKKDGRFAVESSVLASFHTTNRVYLSTEKAVYALSLEKI